MLRRRRAYLVPRTIPTPSTTHPRVSLTFRSPHVMLEIDMGSFSKVVLLILASGRIWAGTVTVNDLFNVPGNSDVIGNKLQFDAQSIRITTNGSTLTIDIFTNYDNPNLYSVRDTGARLNPGDLFFTVNGTFTYGIPLALHNGPAGGPW